MRLSDFMFDLPPELIAQTPANPRDSSRLMVVHRETGEVETKYFFRDLPSILSEHYTIVLNDSRVLKSRLTGYKGVGDQKIDLYLLKDLDSNHWYCQDCSSIKLKENDRIYFDKTSIMAVVTKVYVDPRIKSHNNIECYFEGTTDLAVDIEKFGHLPVPPYIKSAASEQQYQTIYADEIGSVAAPTAGLHFTPEVFSGLASKGIECEKLTLHVGYGTFASVENEDLTAHKMHSEYFTLTDKTADRLNRCRQNNKKILAVGTTVTRVLETCTSENGLIAGRSGETNIFIYPPYSFKAVDAMLTNFHFPGYTPIMLVAALAGHELIKEAYNIAIRERYRFYSFGDSMLVI
jgi:S-adenosylmethionine:tRNA ribosyltransferase-isomerase